MLGLHPHLTWQSFWMAVVTGSGSSAFVLQAVSANGTITKLEWVAVVAVFALAAIGSVNRTTHLPRDTPPTDPTKG